MRTCCVKNGLVVATILLFIGVAVQPGIAIVQPESNDMPYVDEHSSIEVTITEPENGIYRNNHKILPFFIPLVLCGNISIDYKVLNGSGLERTEFYINGVLLISILGSGTHYVWFLSWGPFLKIKFGIAVYTFDGNHSIDEITIWRIFR